MIDAMHRHRVEADAEVIAVDLSNGCTAKRQIRKGWRAHVSVPTWELPRPSLVADDRHVIVELVAVGCSCNGKCLATS